MKKLTLILLIISSLSVFSQKDKRLKNIEKELNKVLKTSHVAGFAVAIVEGDKIIYSKGFGYRDIEKKLPVDANTLFAIGSSTKAFTSSILGQLKAGDSLCFEDSPRKYLPQLEFYNAELNSNIIIKDLMSHQTGIPRHDVSWYLFPTKDADSLVQRIKYHEPFTGLRQQWYYNNFMFAVQGEIAHKITRKSWAENIKERFFIPLNMKRSTTSIDELLQKDNRAIGYNTREDGSNEKTDYYHIAGMRAAGSINSSVNEMSNWLIAWLNEGKFERKQVIPKAYLTEAISSHSVVSAHLPKKDFPEYHMVNYGYAWFLSSYRGHYKVDHGGNIDGFSANVIFYPSDSLGIVVLTNQDVSQATTIVRNIISDRMLKTERKDWIAYYKEKLKEKEEAKKKEEITKSIPNTKPSHSLTDYTGIYSHPGYGDFKITLESDILIVDFKRIKYTLKHLHYDVFQIIEEDELSSDFPLFNFITNADGEISILEIDLESSIGHPIRFKTR